MLLQRSHDLAAVEREMAVVEVALKEELQRSHDLAAVESRADWNPYPLLIPASTEPRPRGRGEPGGGGIGRRIPNASTEPRPRGRGEEAQQGGDQLLHVGFNGATTSRPWRERLCVAGERGRPASTEPRPRGRGERRRRSAKKEPIPRLQRSHDLAAVERRCAAEKTRASEMASTEPRPRGRGETP